MKNQFLIFGISAPAKGSVDHCAVAAVVDDISAAVLVAAVAVVFYFNETLFIESFVALHSD